MLSATPRASGRSCSNRPDGQLPIEAIATLSYEFRTLGLGYANLGAMLMQAGIPYDSEKGRAICGALTAILTGESYAAN